MEGRRNSMGDRFGFICSGIIIFGAILFDDIITAIIGSALWISNTIFYVNEKNHKT